jgi:hypothetical protein
MEVGNKLHRDDEVTAKGNEHVNTDPITKKIIPIRDSTTFAPTERSLKTPAVGKNNRANLIRDDSVIKAIVTTCRLYYKPDTQTTIDSVLQILTDAHKSMKITEQKKQSNGQTALKFHLQRSKRYGLDFKVMVKRQIFLNAANRLSEERIDK